MGSGVNVAVARGLGMGDRQRVEKTVHTSFVLCAAIGVVLCLICVLLARPMLALLHTKDELMDGAVLYLKIYALSMPAMAVYNCGNGIMSAVGDTRAASAVSVRCRCAERGSEPVLCGSAATWPPRAWPSPASSPSACRPC